MRLVSQQFKRFQFQKSVKIIDDNAFYNCNDMNDVIFSKECELTYIGKYEFSNTGIRRLEIHRLFKT